MMIRLFEDLHQILQILRAPKQTFLIGIAICLLICSSAGLAQEHRIVSLTPSITKTIADLNKSHRLVGITTYCTRPADATPAKIIGTIQSPNIELIVSLEPTLVIGGIESNRQQTFDKLASVNIPLLIVDHEKNFDDLIQSTKSIAMKIGAMTEANQLIMDSKKRVESMRQKQKSSSQPSVFIEIWPGPLKTASNQVFLHDIFKTAGFRNVFANSSINYPTVSMEAVINQEPDCIVILTHSLIDDSRIEQYRQYPQFEKVPIIQYDQGEFTQPNLLNYVNSVNQLNEWKETLEEKYFSSQLSN